MPKMKISPTVITTPKDWVAAYKELDKYYNYPMSYGSLISVNRDSSAAVPPRHYTINYPMNFNDLKEFHRCKEILGISVHSLRLKGEGKNDGESLRGLFKNFPEAEVLKLINIGYSFGCLQMPERREALHSLSVVFNTGLFHALSDIEFETLVYQCPNLKELTLLNTDLTGQVIEQLSCVPDLAHLVLKNSQITGDDDVSEDLAPHYGIKYLNLSDNEQLKGNIGKILKALPNLEVLDISNCWNSYNSEDETGWKVDQMSDNDGFASIPKLEKLYTLNAGGHNALFLNDIVNVPSLKHLLRLSATKPQSSNLVEVYKGLDSFDKLETLSITQPEFLGIRDDDEEPLLGLSGLKDHPSLNNLIIKGVVISPETLNEISQCQKLKKLQLVDVTLERGEGGADLEKSNVEEILIDCSDSDISIVDQTNNWLTALIKFAPLVKRLTLTWDLFEGLNPLKKYSVLNSLQNLTMLERLSFKNRGKMVSMSQGHIMKILSGLEEMKISQANRKSDQLELQPPLKKKR